ncbi:MAG: hypothetical protein JSV06_07660 [Myxococcales bacterium]|nr:MAG: hypothetical protein JSV06_07660 [Myxococcales bacterium]
MASNMRIRGFSLALAVGLAACSSGGDDGPGGPTDESWTIGIYMAADNNLDRAATNDINEILRAGVPENTSALILVDRAELGEYGGFGSIEGLQPHSTAKWLRITGNTLVEEEDLGEIDTADPETVRMFLDRLAEEDVERKAAIFWDHGSSFTFGSDDSAPFSRAMGVDEIAAQFREVPVDENSLYRKVDIVGFDACLMSSVEALAEFNDAADFYVASAELEPGDGWDYSALFNFMGRTPDLTPRDLATAIVDGYADYYSNNPGRAGGLRVTQAAWSTGTGEVEAAIAGLADAYEKAGEDVGNYNLIADLFSAQSKSTFYNRRTDNPAETTSWIDVGEFLANHTEQGGDAVAEAAETLRRALESIRVANRADGRDELVMGLSVYFPANQVGRNSGASDEGSRSVETDSRLLAGGYGIIQSLIDKEDPTSAVGSLRATDRVRPSLSFDVVSVGPDDVKVDFDARDDVMLVSGYGLLLYRTDDDQELALAGARNPSIGVDTYKGEGSLPLVGVVVGPEGTDPVSGRVGFIARESERYSVPVVVVQGERRERGVLLLSDDGAIEGVGVLREDGTWALFAWEDAQAISDVEIGPLWFTVDPAGEYETNEGDTTPIADVNVRFVDLADTSRLSLVLSVTDIAGNTTVSPSASLRID